MATGVSTDDPPGPTVASSRAWDTLYLGKPILVPNPHSS